MHRIYTHYDKLIILIVVQNIVLCLRQKQIIIIRIGNKRDNTINLFLIIIYFHVHSLRKKRALYVDKVVSIFFRIWIGPIYLYI